MAMLQKEYAETDLAHIFVSLNWRNVAERHYSLTYCGNLCEFLCSIYLFVFVLLLNYAAETLTKEDSD